MGAKIQMGFQFSSAFARRLCGSLRFRVLFLTARFVGKMDDDSVLHDARVLMELIESHRFAARRLHQLRPHRC